MRPAAILRRENFKYNVEELAETAGVKNNTLRVWVSRGVIPRPTRKWTATPKRTFYNQHDFDELVEKCRERVFHLSFRIVGNREDAYDVSQEDFLTVYQKIGGWKPKAPFRSWLYRITVNFALKRWKQNAKHRSVLVRQDKMGIPDIPDRRTSKHPDKAAESKEIEHRIAKAVENLPVRQRTAFILRYYESMTIKEAASVLKCSEGTVKANVFHAIRKLRDQLKDLYVGSP